MTRGVSNNEPEDTQVENTETTAIHCNSDGFTIGSVLGGCKQILTHMLRGVGKQTVAPPLRIPLEQLPNSSSNHIFSISQYTGGNGSWGSTNQIGHGLSATPIFVIQD